MNYFSKGRKGLNKNGKLNILDYFNVDFPKGITAPPIKMRVSVDQRVTKLKRSGFTSISIEVNLLPLHYKGKIITITMIEFWEEAFKDKQEMWGLLPAHSATLVKDFFVEQGIKNILIPGIGYGRNAKVFVDAGITVTGIEISNTAIELATKNFGTSMKIYHGSVTDMPFDNNKYDGIFCYGLIHLLDKEERAKLISDCYNQLTNTGYMIFTTITKQAQTYGHGTLIGKDRYEMFGGVKMFFFDREFIIEAFDKVGLIDVTEVNENYPFYLIKCRKE